MITYTTKDQTNLIPLLLDLKDTSLTGYLQWKSVTLDGACFLQMMKLYQNLFYSLIIN